MLLLNPKPSAQDSDGSVKPPSNFERFFACAAHLAAVFWLPVIPMPYVALLLPFFLLQFGKVHSDFVQQHAIESCNFQLLMGCFYLLALLAGGAFNASIFVWWMAAGALLFCLWQGARALNGWAAKYPVTFSVFK